MLKRQLAGLVLLLAFLTNSFTVHISAEDTSIPLTESSVQIEEAEAFLKGIDIDTGFMEKNSITRGDFTKNVLNLMNIPFTSNGVERVFADVNEKHIHYGTVWYAAKVGLVSQGAENFRPDEAITYAEAIKLCVTALEYSALAELAGGYPAGYFSKADKAGILLSSSLSDDKALSGLQAGILLYKTLIADVVQTDISNARIKFNTEKGKNLLTENHHLEKIQGVVTATQFSALSSQKRYIKQNRLQINGTDYLYFDDAEKFLGYFVQAYAEKDSDDLEKTIAFLVPKKNETVAFFSEEVQTAEAKKYVLENGESYILDDSLYFIYNNMPFYEYTVDDMSPKGGHISLIDNNHDGIFDVVLVSETKYMTVSTVNTVEGVITGVGNEGVTLDAGRTDGYFAFYSINGQTASSASISEIYPGSIVAYEISKDGTRGEVFLCQDTLTGTVTEISVESEYILVDGNLYKASSLMLNNAENIVGLSGVFTLGRNGEIVDFKKKTADNLEYGYVVFVSPSQGLQQNLQIKLLKQDGNITILSLDEKCKVNGSRKLDPAAVLLNGQGKTISQLIRFSVSQSGDINAIYTAQEASEFIENQNKEALWIYHKNIASPFKTGMLNFGFFDITAGTKVFVVPSESKSDVEDVDFKVTTASHFRNDQKYTVDSYNFNSSGYPEVIVCYDSANRSADDYSQIAVVEKVVQALPPDGMSDMQDQKVYLWLNGKFTSYYVADGVSLLKDEKNKISLGDIIRFESRDGIAISSLAVDYDADAGDFAAAGKGLVLGDAGYSRLISYTVASVYKRFGNKCFISSVKENGSYNYDIGNLRVINIGTAKCLLINMDSNQIVPIYPSEILDYASSGAQASEILIKQRYWGCELVIIYRGGDRL